MKNVILSIVMIITMSLGLVADSSYDRTIEVMDKTRDQEVERVFRELIASYQDEDARGFLENVSEDRFIQDYITFSDAIYQDFRLYDILEIKYWIDGIVPKGNNKRYLNVRWTRYSTSLANSDTFEQEGISRFLFDEINGEYKLIELAGNNLWANSSAEWKEEVPMIAGQEPEEDALTKPDLSVSITNAEDDGNSWISVDFTITNNGESSTTSAFDWSIECESVEAITGRHTSDIGANDTVDITSSFFNVTCSGVLVIIDTNDEIDESNEDNNENSSIVQELIP